ncbi:hypothetical protein SELMODRAFT_171048 [Selaginella moellendorffii]|uniref:non-specific serine/threonine protein kinase n=2 Tax=Selaginella moellendorffii TaxID=88036 RepID=D8RFP6_SELML|nr:hypothetical protein SELMODRAFT_171048 [Selaginella moellendorffii]
MEWLRDLLAFCLAIAILPLTRAATERELLLEFKRGIVDPRNVLESWNASTNPQVCSWKGIECDGGDGVVGINLEHFQLNGTMSPVICEFPNLTSVRVTYNNFDQPFPSLERCSKLVHLDLSQNWFRGPLPENISMILGHLPLRRLDLSYNAFTGPMPDALGELPTTLQELVLSANLFTNLTPSLGRLSNLTFLDVSSNINLLRASIPPELGNLTRLVRLYLFNCGLVGTIPPELGALKELEDLELQSNNLTGSIPVELMYLPKLKMLELYKNKLSGQIPYEIGNLMLLTDLDASENALTGSIPTQVGGIKNLRILHLHLNRLTGSIPESLADLENLEEFTAFANNLTGKIPESLGKKARLSYVTLSQNKLTGGVPPFICGGNALQNLSLYGNMLSGGIPESFSDCKSWVRLRLQDNHLEGPVPPKLWASPNLTVLELSSNRLNGSVTSDIKNAAQLGILRLDGNKFESLPDELGNLPNLSELTASDNAISGFQIGSCASLEVLNLSHNLLSGAIPADIRNCVKLSSLDFSANSLSGSIPSSLASLSRLNMLDLSDNHLSGDVPSALGNLLLSSLNISNNNLSGRIPESWTRGFSADSFFGNPDLCQDSACSNARTTSSSRTANSGKSRFSVTLISVVVIVGAVVLLLTGTLCICWRHFKLVKQPPRWKVKSFQRLFFNELTVIEKLDENNVIGSGRSGKVYRVDLASGHSLAVKQISRSDHSLGDDYQYQSEVRTLGHIRHRSIVRLLSCCWNADTDLLIFEYMPNGSLRDVLHSKKVANLDWNTRYRIALRAAQALSYLHHDCSPPLLHRDVKSANILLDADYEPKLADFGITKLLKGSDDETMTNIAGSYGYIAPEYTYTLKVSTKSDTYSFGVVLLELVTGKRPVDSEFGDLDIVRWVKGIVQAKGPQVVLDTRVSASAQDQMIMLLDVALLCTKASPEERATMRRVVEMLEKIQPEACYSPCTKEEMFSPASTSGSTSPCSIPEYV